MDSWYLFALAALVLFGIQRFLYKVSAEENCSTAVTTFAFMGTVTCLSTLAFFTLGGAIDNIPWLVFISLVNSLSFFAGTVLTIESLKHIPASVAMPLIRLNIILVVLYGMFVFGDQPSPWQGAGIAAALAVIFILARSPSPPGGATGTVARGILYAAAALVAGAVAAVSSAHAALTVNKPAFMALSYFLGTLFAIAMHKRREPAEGGAATKKALLIGLTIGIVNFAGFFSLLQALARGPVSIIVPFTGLYFVVAVILSAIVYGEKIDTARGFALVLTILAVVMMRF